MRPYSMDLRQRVIDDCDAGLPTKQVAEKHQVSRAWVRRLKQQRRQRGDIKPRRDGHRPRQIDRDRLAQLVGQQPDATLAELRERLGLACSLSAICMALQELKLTFKKSPCTPPNRTARMSPTRGRPSRYLSRSLHSGSCGSILGSVHQLVLRQMSPFSMAAWPMVAAGNGLQRPKASDTAAA